MNIKLIAEHIGNLKEDQDHSIQYVKNRQAKDAKTEDSRISKVIYQMINAIKKIEKKLGIDSGIEDAENTLVGSEGDTDLSTDD